MRFDEPSAGEWVQPVQRGYLLACCDCGLVHRMDFRVTKNRRRGKPVAILGNARAWFRVYRDEAATAELRARNGLG